MPAIFTVCIAFLDVSIESPEAVKKLNIPSNAMTPYETLSQELKVLLLSYLEKKDKIKISYGGMVYNTFMEISRKSKSIKAVFIGPFSTSEVSEKVFKKALQGEIGNLTIIPEMVDIQPDMCFVIPNEANRAMVTKTNPEMKITKKMVEKLILQVRKRDRQKKRSLVYIAGYTAETEASVEKIARKKLKKELNALFCLNLSDPGVIKRSYKKIKIFIQASDWVIGNRQEFSELFYQIEGFYPETTDQLHASMQKNIRSAVITSGEESVVALYKEKNIEKVSVAYPEKVKVGNTTGAGDVLAAGILSGIAKNQSIDRVLPKAVKRTTAYLLAKAAK